MKSTTVKKSYKIINLIESLQRGEFVLPEIQREFVWEMDRISELWDSIYRGYPIGQLLFWEAKTNIPTYSFFDTTEDIDNQYLFVNKRPHWNHKTQESSNDKIIVLDGQQRLTSLFLGASPEGIALKRRKNSATEKRFFCIYIGKKDIAGDNEIKLFDWRKNAEDADYISVAKALKSRKQNSRINTLKRRLRESASAVPIDYINSNSESDVVEIFRRLNNNGRNMNKSELFLAMWFGSTNAANIREDLVSLKESFGNDFDVSDSTVTQLIASIFGIQDKSRGKAIYSPELFKDITSNLPKLNKAIRGAVDFLNNDCKIYSNSEMVSHSLFIPIAHVFYKFDCNLSEKLKKELQCFTYRALAFDLFASSTNSTLSSLKKSIDGMKEDNLIEALSSTPKAQDIFGDYINKKDQWLIGPIEKLLESKKGSKTNQILLLLRQDKANTFDSEAFDQDHLIAKDLFDRTTAGALNADTYGKFGIRKNGTIDEELEFSKSEINRWKQIAGKKKNKIKADTLPNLWLLESSENQAKGKKLLNIWYSELNKDKQADFIKNAFFGKNCSYEDLKITNFNAIYSFRKDELRKNLLKLLALPRE